MPADSPTSMRPAVVRHVILDRDGVLNREAPDGGWMHSAQDWEWEPNALEGLRRIAATGVRISVATNQSGVGRGVFPLSDVDAVHQRMVAEAAGGGGRIDAVFVCPHAPEDRCHCRKPASGLIIAAVEASGVPAAETIVVGDARRDLDAGMGAGVRALLVRTGKGLQTESGLDDGSFAVFDDLLGVAEAIEPIAERS